MGSTSLIIFSGNWMLLFKHFPHLSFAIVYPPNPHLSALISPCTQTTKLWLWWEITVTCPILPLNFTAFFSTFPLTFIKISLQFPAIKIMNDEILFVFMSISIFISQSLLLKCLLFNAIDRYLRFSFVISVFQWCSFTNSPRQGTICFVFQLLISVYQPSLPFHFIYSSVCPDSIRKKTRKQNRINIDYKTVFCC